MPPKVRISKEDIVNVAINLVKEGGRDAINARAIAKALNCSTQPIFSNFTSMEELETEVEKSSYRLYYNFIDKEIESGKYPKYKAFGMAYIRFAGKEKELFKLLFMRDRTYEDTSPSPDFNASVEMIMNTVGLSHEKAELMHLEMWSCVHGIAVMSATSFLSLDWEIISNIVTDVYQGLCAKHTAEVKE